MTEAAENRFMEQIPNPAHTEAHAQAVAAVLDRLYRKTMEDYLGMRYDERIGWYRTDGELLPRITVKREEKHDESTD